MPWINEKMCAGCAVCIDTCPSDAITMNGDTALIDQENCIRCGTCHDICPQDAVRHDSERIPFLVDENIKWAQKLIGHGYYETLEKKGLIKRIKNHLNMQKKVAELSLARITEIEQRLST